MVPGPGAGAATRARLVARKRPIEAALRETSPQRPAADNTRDA
jgi:hypothetical protein